MGAALFLLFDLYRAESVRRSDVHAYIIECCSVPSVRDSFGDESVEVAARRTGEPPHALADEAARKGFFRDKQGEARVPRGSGADDRLPVMKAETPGVFRIHPQPHGVRRAGKPFLFIEARGKRFDAGSGDNGKGSLVLRVMRRKVMRQGIRVRLVHDPDFAIRRDEVCRVAFGQGKGAGAPGAQDFLLLSYEVEYHG